MQSTFMSPNVYQLLGTQLPCKSMVGCMLLGLKFDQQLLTISQSHTTNGNTRHNIRVANIVHLHFLAL